MTTEKKPEISYPCSWKYNLIGHDISSIEKAARAILADAAHSLTKSKQSSSGKYVSVNLELDVTSEAHRDSIFIQFRDHIDIKFVI